MPVVNLVQPKAQTSSNQVAEKLAEEPPKPGVDQFEKAKKKQTQELVLSNRMTRFADAHHSLEADSVSNDKLKKMFGDLDALFSNADSLLQSDVKLLANILLAKEQLLTQRPKGLLISRKSDDAAKAEIKKRLAWYQALNDSLNNTKSDHSQNTPTLVQRFLELNPVGAYTSSRSMLLFLQDLDQLLRAKELSFEHKELQLLYSRLYEESANFVVLRQDKDQNTAIPKQANLLIDGAEYLSTKITTEEALLWGDARNLGVQMHQTLARKRHFYKYLTYDRRERRYNW